MVSVGCEGKAVLYVKDTMCVLHTCLRHVRGGDCHVFASGAVQSLGGSAEDIYTWACLPFVIIVWKWSMGHVVGCR